MCSMDAEDMFRIVFDEMMDLKENNCRLEAESKEAASKIKELTNELGQMLTTAADYECERIRLLKRLGADLYAAAREANNTLESNKLAAALNDSAYEFDAIPF